MLVSKKHKKLLLNLREPSKVTTLIPTAQVVEIKGKPIVVVPHRDDEVKVLRNIGIDAPSPMGYYYDWPGRFQPFAHQRITAEFLASNQRAFCLNGLGCISGDALVRVSRKGKSEEMRLDVLYAKFHELGDKDAWKVRSLMDGRFGMNRLLDVLNKGVKHTLRIELEDGKVFYATPDHSIARPDGSWTNAGDLKVGDQLVTNGRVMLACPACGNEREVDKYYAQTKRTATKTCRACKHAKHSDRMKGDGNPSWNGGRFVDGDGYVRIHCPDHHRADHNGYVYEHILVAEQVQGIAIDRFWHVHHINGVKHDNRPENLAVLPEDAHHRHHDPRPHLDGSVSAKGGRVVVLPKQSKIVSITDGGMREVFDLCMQDPHNNFVVNGVVVHNSGKTMSVLWAFDYLRKQGRVRKMLVISPLSTLERTWGDEIFRNMIDYKFAVLHGTADKRLKLLRADFDIYIINHDGLKTKEVLSELLTMEDLDLIVVDEMAVFRTAGTDRFKALNLLVNGNVAKGIKPKEWAWALTGTPTPNAPTDAWAQVRIINPGNVPKFFGHFRDRVMHQVTQYKWTPKNDAVSVVSTVMQPSVRFATADCIDLPPTTTVTRHVELTPEQKKAYKEMMSKLHTEVAGGQITAVNEAVKLSKCIQIALGVAYNGSDENIDIPAGPRVELVREIVEEAEGKVIVFVPLTGALNKLAAELRKDFTVEVVCGATSKTDRDRIFGDFQKAKDPRVLVANPATCSHGLTLTAANVIVWYAPTTSNEQTEQANARIVRPGQTRKTLIVQIEGTDVERKIYERLQTKSSMQGLLLDLMKEKR